MDLPSDDEGPTIAVSHDLQAITHQALQAGELATPMRREVTAKRLADLVCLGIIELIFNSSSDVYHD